MTPAASELRSFVERVQRVNFKLEERHDQKRLVYAEARGSGFDANILKGVIRQARDGHVSSAEQISAAYLREVELQLIERARRQAELPPAPKAKVYFAIVEGRSLLKIGISRDVSRRLDNLSRAAAHDLKLIAAYPGGRQDEQQALDSFAQWRVRSEWFHWNDDSRAFLASWLAKHLPACEAAA